MRPKKKKNPEHELELIQGVLHLHPRGFGFVTPESDTLNQDVFIPKMLMQSALDADLVEVALAPRSKWEKGPEGSISKVIKRGRSEVAGIIMEEHVNQDLLAYIPLFGISKPVLLPFATNEGFAVGDRVVVKMIDYPEGKKLARGKIIKKIGSIEDPSVDLAAVIKEYDLSDHFSEKTLTEVKKYKVEVEKKDLKGRVDLTKEECFTIDPETARDFDDALTLTRDKKGSYHLGVHIADVSHYVAPATSLDKEAYARGNSTYFPSFCLPMLPEELSNHLCSLKPNVVRLTVSVFMSFNSKGDLKSYEIKRSYIKSCKRFSYEEAKRVLDGKEESPHLPTLNLMVDLCRLLKEKRSARGSIDFSLPEVVLICDEKGVPTHLKTVEYDITHQLVEEFMLKANEVVATHLTNQGKELLFRIHEKPDLSNMEEFFSVARMLGYHLSPNPSTKEVQDLFEKAKGTPFAKQLSTTFIRMMKMAFYSPDNVGHYGLKLEHYCHFTSPIRRYSDLVIHRLLFEEESDRAKLKSASLLLSQKERTSMRAENQVKTLKKLRYLQIITKDDPSKVFTAYITKVMHYGFYFDISDLSIEGFLHVSDLKNDYFTFNSDRNILVGRATKESFFPGKEIHVSLESVDLILLESNYRLVQTKKKK